MLGGSDGHYLKLENISDWEFLQAKTSLSEERCNEILNLLSNLDAIDQELWESNIIWSDNFLSNIADVYKNRRVEMPSPSRITTDRNP